MHRSPRRRLGPRPHGCRGAGRRGPPRHRRLDPRRRAPHRRRQPRGRRGAADRCNVVFGSTTIARGRGRGVVFATDMFTEMGLIAGAFRGSIRGSNSASTGATTPLGSGPPRCDGFVRLARPLPRLHDGRAAAVQALAALPLALRLCPRLRHGGAWRQRVRHAARRGPLRCHDGRRHHPRVAAARPDRHHGGGHQEDGGATRHHAQPAEPRGPRRRHQHLLRQDGHRDAGPHGALARLAAWLWHVLGQRRRRRLRPGRRPRVPERGRVPGHGRGRAGDGGSARRAGVGARAALLPHRGGAGQPGDARAVGRRRREAAGPMEGPGGADRDCHGRVCLALRLAAPGAVRRPQPPVDARRRVSL